MFFYLLNNERLPIWFRYFLVTDFIGIGLLFFYLAWKTENPPMSRFLMLAVGLGSVLAGLWAKDVLFPKAKEEENEPIEL